MSDDGRGVVLILLDELFCARKGNLIDVFINLLGRHTNTSV